MCWNNEKTSHLYPHPIKTLQEQNNKYIKTVNHSRQFTVFMYLLFVLEVTLSSLDVDKRRNVLLFSLPSGSLIKKKNIALCHVNLIKYFHLRWPKTVFARVLANAVQRAHKDSKKQTWRQYGDHFICSRPALSVLFFFIIERSVLMVLVI